MFGARGIKETDPTLTMSAEEWQQAKAALPNMAKLSPQERTRLLESRFPGKKAFRNNLTLMLEAPDKMKEALAPDVGKPLASDQTTLDLAQITTLGSTRAEGLIELNKSYGPSADQYPDGRFPVIGEIGRGGMGKVFLAQDLKLGREVALKTLSTALVSSLTVRKDLVKEAKFLARLNHDHIATLFDVIVMENYDLLVMEHVVGSSADKVLADTEKPLSLVQALKLMIQVCDAVESAHQENILHCDLKPANIQITHDRERAKVLDFGLAHPKYALNAVDGGSSDSKGIVGTPAYMPPERLRTGVLDTKGDIYSLGVTLFEMVTKSRLYRKPDMDKLIRAILDEEPAPKASSINRECPAELDAVIKKALEKDLEKRYKTVDEFRNDLVYVKEKRFPTGSRFWSYSPPLVIAVLVLAVVASLTFLGFLTSVSYGAGLGITSAFEGESPISWPVWGLRSLAVRG